MQFCEIDALRKSQGVHKGKSRRRRNTRNIKVFERHLGAPEAPPQNTLGGFQWPLAWPLGQPGLSQPGGGQTLKVFTGWPDRHTFQPFLIFPALLSESEKVTSLIVFMFRVVSRDNRPARRQRCRDFNDLHAIQRRPRDSMTTMQGTL